MANWKQIFLLSAALAAATGVGGATPIRAQTAEVKVGLIAPMSGPWARQGDLMLKGAQLAIDDINQAGGIAAMGGAKMKLVVFDAGDTVEKAKNTAQRMVAQEPDLVGATGAWLSSFTLGVTEVTERAELPLITLSYSDQITARGFKYVFQTSLTGGLQAKNAVPALVKLAEAATGKKPQTVGDRSGQYRGVGGLCQADAGRWAAEARAQARGRRNFHAPAVGLHAADPEGTLDAAGDSAPAADGDSGRQAVPGKAA